MSAIIHVDGVELDVSDDREPRMLDADLAKRLGYKRPRVIRELIKSLIADGEIAEPSCRRQRRRIRFGANNQVRETEVAEYLLDEDQVISVCMAAKTDKAREVRKFIRVVFRAAMRQLFYSDSPANLIAHLLGPKTVWTMRFKPSLVKAICGVYGKDRHWTGGSQPLWIGAVWDKLYPKILTSPVYEEARRRALVAGPIKHKNNLHQQLTSGDALQDQLGIVEVIAQQSADREDFWRRIDRQYSSAMLQLVLVHPTKQLGAGES